MFVWPQKVEKTLKNKSHTTYYGTFQCGRKNIFRKILNYFLTLKTLKKHPESCILMAVGRFFFSVAPTAQNSPELNIHFIDSCIQIMICSTTSGLAYNLFFVFSDCLFIYFPEFATRCIGKQTQ